MDSSQIMMVVIFIILIGLSGLFSSAETAFMSVSKIRVKTVSEDEEDPHHAKALIVSQLLEDTDHLLSTILVGNNLVNILASSLTTSFVISVFGNEGIGVAVATGFVTLMILIFGEITPKTLAVSKAEELCYRFCRFIQFINFIFTPVVVILTAVSHGLIHILGGNIDPQPTLSEEDLKTIVNVSHEEGVLEDEEKEMMHNIFDFGDTDIKEIMTPRIHVATVDYDATYDEVVAVLQESQYSRLPVLSEEGDEIVGVLHIKDILMKPVDHEHFQVKDYMRDAYFVYEFNHISDVFASMRKEHVSLSVVLDEYGVMAGIVTLEDIVEEIVGEIDDEYDDNSEEVKKISKNVYLVDGSLNIDEVNDRCGTEFASEEFESIGGLVLGQVNGSPNPHQKVYVDDCMFIIEKIDKNRIELLRLIIPEEESQKENEEKHD